MSNEKSLKILKVLGYALLIFISLVFFGGLTAVLIYASINWLSSSGMVVGYIMVITVFFLAASHSFSLGLIIRQYGLTILATALYMIFTWLIFVFGHVLRLYIDPEIERVIMMDDIIRTIILGTQYYSSYFIFFSVSVPLPAGLGGVAFAKAHLMKNVEGYEN